MTRKPAVPNDDFIQILRSKNDIYNEKGCIVGPTHQIWEQIQRDHKLPMSIKAIYTFALKNMRKDLEEENNDFHSNQTESFIHVSASDDTEMESSEEILSDIENQDRFNVDLSWSKWEIIKPCEANYKRFDAKTGYCGEKKYTVLKPGVWTDVINREIWLKRRLPCTWIYKRAKVYPNSTSYFLVIIAKCKECESTLKGTSLSPPNPKEGLVISFVIIGDTTVKHSVNIKRPLSGQNRSDAVNELIGKQQLPTYFRKNLAREDMNFLDPEPSHIPSLEVLRKAKSQRLSKDLLHQDPISAIVMLKHTDSFRNIFTDIGIDKFFIHYWSTEQLRVYAAYTNISPHVKVCIDASGGIVKKLQRPGNTLSGHIFLYVCVISLPGEKEGQISVCQMLSERHNANAIAFWLNEWIRSGAKIPNEVVCDFSPALINAACRVFSKISDTQKYIDTCYEILLNSHCASIPTCFIRVDVAHLIKLVTGWKCLKGKPKRVKEFYIRGVAQMILTTSLEDAGNLLKSMFIIALCETEGKSESTGEETVCEIHKKWLKDRLSTGDVNDIYDVNQPSNEEEQIEGPQIDNQDGNEECFGEPNHMVAWVEKIRRESFIAVDDGDRDNLQHLPAIIEPLSNLSYKLPLWTGIMINVFKRGTPTASSAAVESHFNDLKTRLLTPLPTRIDSFLVRHIHVIDGTMKIVAGNNFFQNQEDITIRPGLTERLNETETIFHPITGMTNTEEPEENTVCGEVEMRESATNDGSRVINNNTEIHVPITRENFKGLESGTEINNNISESGLNSFSSTCIACKLTGAPTGAHKCNICERNVHALDGCSIAVGEESYGQKRLCMSCICISKETNYRKEMSSVENWRGQAVPPKKRLTSTYLTPCPEWRIMDDSNLKKKMKIGILKNGNSKQLKSIKVGNQRISLSNTCAFDSLVQLLACCYCDSLAYKQEIDAIQPSMPGIYELAIRLATKGVDRAIYIARSKLLLSTCQQNKMPAGLLNVDCAITSTEVAKQFLNSCPSFKEVTECSSKFCPKPQTDKNFSILRVNSEVLESMGISKLQIAVESGQSLSNHTVCYNIIEESDVPKEFLISDSALSPHNLCNGYRNRTTTSGYHLLIEVIGRQETVPEPSANFPHVGIERPLHCELLRIPLQMKMCGKEYRLRGCMGFFPPSCGQGIGHYAAYCRRLDGNWEMFNDLKDKVIRVSHSTKVFTHLIMYSI